MPEKQKAHPGIVRATILFTLMLLPPLLSISNKPVFAGDIPLLFAYIFSTWLAYVGYMAWQSRKSHP